MGSRDDDTVLSLANRLVRLAKQLDDKAKARIEKASGGIPVGKLGKALITALDPDVIVQAALATAKAKGITGRKTPCCRKKSKPLALSRLP